MTQNSVITITRRIKTCRASSGATATLPPITHIAFGDGGTDHAGNPVPPTDQQTALTHELARYPVKRVSYPEQITARYEVEIPQDELIDASINEIALVDSDGDVAAIKTFYDKRKDRGTAFTFEVDDQF